MPKKNIISDIIDKMIVDKKIPENMKKETIMEMLKEKGVISEGMSEEEMIQKITATIAKGNLLSDWIDGLMLSDAEPKNEIMLFPFGTFEHQKYGQLKFDKLFFEDIINNFKKGTLGIQPFMDTEHDMGKSLAWFEEAPYIKDGVGLFAKPRWTKLGKELLSDEIYKYFSPWFEDFTNPSDGKTYKNVFRGGAATNIPFLKMMPPIADTVKLHDGRNTTVNIQLSEICEYSNNAKGNTPPANEVTPNGTASKIDEKKNESKMSEKILIGGHYMTLEEVQKENERILAESKIKDEENAKLKVQLEEANKKAEKAAADGKKLGEEVVTIQSKLVSMEAETVIGKALSEGRIPPKDKEYWMKRFGETPARTKEDIEHLPVSVTLGEEIGSGNAGEDNHVSTGKDPATKLHEMALKVMGEKKISYSDAIREVSMSGEGKKLAEATSKTNYRVGE